jgi:DNA-binding GntR family transcriptional regulator
VKEKAPLSAEIKKLPLERQAAGVIRDRILSGQFAPGYRLVETWLAEQLGLSRGTVRAALSQLVHEGLVEQVAYTRWAVPELSDKDAWELYTLRSALEGLAARLVAERISPATSAPLRQAFAEIQDAASRNDRAGLTERDAALHKLIIQLSDNRRLERQYTVIEQQIRRYIASSNALVLDPASIVAQHQPIVEAILAGRPAAAEREAKQHNVEEGGLLVEQLRRAAAEKKAG